MKIQIPMKYEKLLVGSNTNLAHLKCPFQRSSSFGNLFADLYTFFIIFNHLKNQSNCSQSKSSVSL